MTYWLDAVYCVSTPTDGVVNTTSAPATIDGVTPPLGARVLLLQQGFGSSNNTTWQYNGHLNAMMILDTPLAGAAVRATNGNTLAHTEHSLNDTTDYQWTRQLVKANVKDFGALG